MNQLKKLRSLLTDETPAVLLTGAPNRQYATDMCIDEGMCLVTKEDCVYLTDSRYIEAAKRGMLGTGWVEQVDRDHTYTRRINDILAQSSISKLGVEEERLTHGEFTRLTEKLDAGLVPCQAAVDGLRAVKDPWELERLRMAQARTDEVFSQMLPVIRPGMTEKELEAELIYRLYRAGAQGLSFPPIVVSGPNTSMPHGVAGQRVLQAGDFVTMDFGMILDGYCSDMTRTVALGYATDEMKAVYDTVLRAQEAGIAATCAGKTGQQIDWAARAVIEDAGYGEFFGHSYGHSLGIEVHESPNCAPSCTGPIPAGAVCSAEPGIYLPGRFGVRIEDVVIFTAGGRENITGSPKELLIL